MKSRIPTFFFILPIFVLCSLCVHPDGVRIASGQVKGHGDDAKVSQGYKFLVSLSVVLRRWESETWKFGFLIRVDKGWITHRERFGKLTFRALALCQSELLGTSTLINSFDKKKLSWAVLVCEIPRFLHWHSWTTTLRPGAVIRVSKELRQLRQQRVQKPNKFAYYITTQGILAFWLVLAHDLLEDRRIDDDSARFNFFLIFWILNLNQSQFFTKHSNQH